MKRNSLQNPEVAAIRRDSRGKKLHLRSVRTGLFGYFCLLSFLLILLVDIVFYIVVSSSLTDQIRERVVSVGKETIILSDFPETDDEVLGRVFDRRMEEGLLMYIVSREGQTIVPDNRSFGLNEEVVGNLLNRIEGKNNGEYVTYVDNNSLNFVANVGYSGGSVLFISCRLGIIYDVIGVLQLYILGISAILLVLAFVISYSISQRLTRGLMGMSATAEQLAKGDYSVNFANADYREMAKLSDSLNNMRDELKKSGDFQREILANVSHDLKTPLTMIKAYASMISEISGDNPEKRNQHLKVIIDEADRLTGLVNDVLSVSKVNSNLTELNLKVFNLTEYVYGVINKFGYLQENDGYNFMVDIDSNLYTRADEEKIGQVIYNLLGNAISYTGEDKTVYISLKSSMDGTTVTFSVRDTGRGIPKEELPNIWDRYYMLKETHNRPVKGTGLGLSIVKTILLNHKFKFGAESEEGKGSTFWVEFPQIPSKID